MRNGATPTYEAVLHPSKHITRSVSELCEADRILLSDTENNLKDLRLQYARDKKELLKNKKKSLKK